MTNHSNNSLIYKLYDVELEFNKPVWWDNITYEGENIIDDIYSLKDDFERLQKNNEIPYLLSSNSADYIGDYEFAIEIYLEIEKYLKQYKSTFDSWFNFYKSLGYFYYEIDDINSSIKYFQKSTEHYEKKIDSNSSKYLNDSYLRLAYKETKKKIIELQSIIDYESYIFQRNNFRNTLLNHTKEIEGNKDMLLSKKSELENFAYTIDIDELNTLELAFLSILNKDKDLSNSDIFTSKVYKEMESILIEYYQVSELYSNQNFTFEVSNIDFPSHIKNNWAIIFSPSEGFELLKVHFNRWNKKEIELLT